MQNNLNPKNFDRKTYKFYKKSPIRRSIFCTRNKRPLLPTITTILEFLRKPYNLGPESVALVRRLEGRCIWAIIADI